ncbi:MAG: CHAT domain-containing protein [Roseivirga sp.]|nr:CHAT domain-containing protein [Roseivirga sp.]
MKSVFTLLWAILSATSLLAQEEILSKADTLHEQARYQANIGRFDSAIYYYDKALEGYKVDDDMASYYHSKIEKAYSLNALRKHQEAFALLEEVEGQAAKIKGHNLLLELYRNKAVIYESGGDFANALKSYQLALDNYEKEDPKASERLASVYIGRGVSLANTGGLFEAGNDWDQALAIFDSLGVNDIRVAKVLNNQGGLTIYMGLMEEAIGYLEKSAELLSELYQNPNHPELIKIYYNLSSAYSKLGLNQKAVQFVQQGRSILKLYNPQDPLMIDMLLGLADHYNTLGDWENAESTIRECLQFCQDLLGTDHRKTGNAYLILGHIFQNKGDNKEAIGSLQKSLDILSKPSVQADPRILALTYLRLGEVQAQNELKEEEALKNLSRALEIVTKNTGGKGNDPASIGNAYAALLYKTGRQEEALAQYQQALIAAVPDFNDTSIEVNPQEVESANEKPLFRALVNKAAILEEKHKTTQDLSFLELAMSTLQLGHKVGLKMDNNPDNYTDRLLIKSTLSRLNSLSVSVSKKLMELTSEDYSDFIFESLEKNKANLIIANVNESIQLGTLDLPDSLFFLKGALAKNIAFLEAQLYQAKEVNQGSDTSRIQKYESELFAYLQSEAEFNENLKKSFPAYHRLKIEKEFTSLDEVRNDLLNENQMMFHYQLNNSSLVLMKISKQGVAIESKTIDREFHVKLKEFIGLLQDSKSAFEDYLAVSKFLSPLLGITPQNLEGKSELLIIPDGDLGLLAFEALVLQNTGTEKSFKDLDYLLKNVNVSYANSATLLALQSSGKSAANPKVAAFAPWAGDGGAGAAVSEDRSELADLIWTEQEVNSIASVLDTRTFLSKEATEKRFKEVIDDYSIIHIASHGLINNEAPLYSRLLFAEEDLDSLNDGNLLTRELFAMRAPADMVVLSACNSGSGDVIRGEGVISMANGFFYAGSRSAVMTLWLANDQSSGQLMKSFYQNLAEGQSKSTSMSAAKLEYINKADALQSHPYYWAHFVVNGNDAPLVSAGLPGFWWFLLFIPVAFFLISRFRKSSAA